MIKQWIEIVKEKHFLVLLFVWCLSRIWTSLYYVADPDSLRFALASLDFDPITFQPHFPLYPVFVFCSQIASFLMGSFARGFSLIGAIAGIVITLSSLNILKWWNPSEGFSLDRKSWILCLFIFLNPMLWLMSNRHMPDLMGLSIVMMILGICKAAYEKTKVDSHSYTKQIFWAGMLCGLLMGVRISYAPLCLPILFFWRSSSLYTGLIIGFFLWFMPLCLHSSILELYDIAIAHSEGHFQKFGGSIATELDMFQRIYSLFGGFWGAGFNGYWEGRSKLLLVHSFFLVGMVILLFSQIKHLWKINLRVWLGIPFVTYGIWIYLGQNIMFKFRHQMPLVLILSILLAWTINHFYETKIKQSNISKVFFCIILSVFMSSFAWGSLKVIQSSQGPVALSQSLSVLKSQTMPLRIVCMSLVCHALEKQGVKANYFQLDEMVNYQYELKSLIVESAESFSKIFLIGPNPKEIFDHGDSIQINLHQRFYHNPWSNPVWSVVHLSELTFNKFNEVK